MREVFILLLACLFGVRGQCPHSSGPWEALPALTGNVVLTYTGSGRYLYDITSPTSITSLTINDGAELVFDNAAADLSLEWLRVAGVGASGGKLTMGSSSCPITAKIVLTFEGPRSAADDLGGGHGTKGIAIEDGASLQLFGAVPANTWTRISSTVQPGSSSFTVQDSLSGWNVGDKIILTSTDYGEVVDYSVIDALVLNGTYNETDRDSLGWLIGRGAADQNEELTITAISGQTITVAESIAFMHWGADNENAEVGLLSRNIVLQGDADSDNSLFGMQLMIRGANQAEIQGVEFFRGGQQAVVGRYPIHFHLIGTTVGSGMHATGNSIHHSYQRCVTIHDTHSILIKDNVAWNIEGHCFFLEDGSELYNTFENNLGVYPKPITVSEGQIVPTDDEPSVYWISNPLNDFIGNVAVGGRYGFWYVFPEFPNGASADDYAPGCGGPPYCPSVDVIVPRKYPHGRFEDNVAHSQTDTGLEIDNMQDANREVELASYHPHAGPFVIPNATVVITDDDVDDGPSIVGHFLRYTAFKCREYGVWARGGPLDYEGFLLMDNLRGYNGVPGPSLLRDSVIIGETGNVGTRRQGGALDDHNNGRSNPNRWNGIVHLKGQESYDNGGPQFLRNVEFINFVHSPSRPAGVHGCLTSAPFVHQTRNKYMEVTFEDANECSILPTRADNDNQVVYLDADYSITDMSPNGWIVANHDSFYALQAIHGFTDTYPNRFEDMVLDGTITEFVEGSGWMLEPDAESCEWHESWNAYACPVHGPGYVQLVMNNEDVSRTDNTGGLYDNGDLMQRVIMHKIGFEKSGWMSGDRNGNKHQFQFNLAPRNAYTLRSADDSATAPHWTLSMQSSSRGDWMIVGLNYPPSAAPFTVQYRRWGGSPTVLPEAASLDDLGRTEYWYYDDTTQHLWLVLVNVNDQWGFDDDFDLFTDYNFDGGFYEIDAIGCSNAACAATNTAVPTSMARADEHEDAYQSEVCGSDGHAMAFFYYSPESNVLSSKVYHTETPRVTDVYIRHRSTGRRTTSPFLGLLSTPARQSEVVSYETWKQLYRGELEIVVEHPGATLTGPILCSEEANACRPPAGIPDISDACDPTGKLVVYDDGPFSGWPNWDGGVWETPPDGPASLDSTYDVEAPLCGSNSMIIVQGDWDGLGLYKDASTADDISAYTHLEFYVRGTANTPQVTLAGANLESDSTGWGATGVDISKEHIHNFAIDDQAWSRIRLPIADFGLGSTTDIKSLQIYVGYQNGGQMEYLLDQIQFVNVAGSDTLADALATGESGSAYRPRNCASAAASLSSFWAAIYLAW